MEYTERMKNVTVIGAAGKMGSGILLLTALEMADQSLKPENKDKIFVLNALDVSDAGLKGLISYVRSQTLKVAEKITSQLRAVYKDRADLIENSQVINQYIEDVVSIIRPTTSIEVAYKSDLVFEAAVENPVLKVKILKQINDNSDRKPWFFTNTSSIPIGNLDKEAGLEGRILGVHFYNPPAIQKLVEVIKASNTLPELVDFAAIYIKNLKKITVPSNDFAGFIGNGHFMRDALHGIQEAEKLAAGMPLTEAVYMVNKVAQDFLVRPMGIFQLIDYVGVEVCQYIMSVMNPYLKDEDLHSQLLDKMVEQGVKGGQFSDGSQKDGFFKYEKGAPVAVYNPDTRQYVAIDSFAAKCDEKLGGLPAASVMWKKVLRDRNKDEKIAAHFAEMKGMSTLGAELAMKYGKRSCDIGKKLVADNVANNDDDVNTVMLTGFFHAYGPINGYFN